MIYQRAFTKRSLANLYTIKTRQLCFVQKLSQNDYELVVHMNKCFERMHLYIATVTSLPVQFIHE